MPRRTQKCKQSWNCLSSANRLYSSRYRTTCFCDASEKAYRGIAYLKFEFMKEKPYCSSFMVKVRLAPIKTFSLPRVELNAAVLGIRPYKSVIKELDLPIYKTTFWKDSTLMLQYIRNDSQCFKTYFANRVT